MKQVSLFLAHWVDQGLGKDDNLDHKRLSEARVVHLEREKGQFREEFGVLFDDTRV